MDRRDRWENAGGPRYEVTVRVAAFVAADPPVLVNTARNSHPFTKAVGVPMIDVEVAPGMEIQVWRPSTETCHCTVGVGLPVAAAVNVTVPPEATVWLAGWVVTTGATTSARHGSPLSELHEGSVGVELTPLTTLTTSAEAVSAPETDVGLLAVVERVELPDRTVAAGRGDDHSEGRPAPEGVDDRVDRNLHEGVRLRRQVPGVAAQVGRVREELRSSQDGRPGSSCGGILRSRTPLDPWSGGLR